jgi:hypothetical protein
MVVVAPGDPGVPVVCWATAEAEVSTTKDQADNIDVRIFMAQPSTLASAASKALRRHFH